ncbi:carboxypeptidase regulatory-like domain-containing protein, partial [Candidatus Latescibacterota bacterium]
PKRTIEFELAAGLIFSKKSFLNRVEAILSDRRIRKISRFAIIGIVVVSIIAFLIAASVPLGEKKEKEAMVTISGKVLFEEKGVSNTNIYLYEPIRTSIEFIEAEKVATTGRDGSFKFNVNASKLPANILVYNKKYAVSWIYLSENTRQEEIQIELGTPATVEGYVLDNSDSPINSAEIKVRGLRLGASLSSGSDTYFFGGIPGLTSRSNSNGYFIVNNLPENAIIKLQIEGNGYEREIGSGITSGMSDIRFSLEPEGRIEGRVIYEDSVKPASGIRVYARNMDINLPNSDIVTTDRNGYFSMTNLQPGLYLAYLQLDDVTNWTAKYIDNIMVVSGKTTKNIEFHLIKGGIITGRVTDEDTGEPIPGQIVSSFGPDTMLLNIHFISDVTDENGEYKIRFFPGETEISMYSPKGYNYEFKKTTVEVIDGKTASGVDFSFNKGLSISGKVLAPDGQPLGGVIIRNTDGSTIVYNFNLTNQGWSGIIRSNDDGTFTIKGVKEGSVVSLEAIDLKKQLRGYYIQDVNQGNEIEIHLEPYETASVEGRVLDNTGNPLPGIRLELFKTMKSGSGALSFEAATTDNSGYYKISNLIMGDRYGLFATSDGFARKGVNMSGLKPGHNLLGDIILNAADRWIEGTISDSDRKLVMGARVIVNGGPSGFQQTFSDASGHYRLENLVPQIESDVAITHHDYGHYRFKNVYTNKETNFTLMIPKYHLSGIVLDSNGNPVSEAYIRINPREHKTGKVYSGKQTDNNGKFRLDDIFDSVVNIEISHGKQYMKFDNIETNRDNVEFIFNAHDSDEPPNSPIEKTQQNQSSEPESMEEKEKMVTVSGKVVFEENPVPDTDIYVFYRSYKVSEQSQVEMITKTDKDGSFTFDIPQSKLDNPIDTRTYIVARNSRYSFGWIDMATEPDKENLVINVYKPTVLEGSVIDNQGNPLENAEVYIYSISQVLDTSSFGLSLFNEGILLGTSTQTDSQGNFRLPGIPEDSNIALMIRKKGYVFEYKRGLYAGSKNITISLVPEGRIEGIVTYADTGKPAKDVILMTQGLGVVIGWGHATTDKNGKYVLEYLPEGLYNVFIEDLPDFTAVAVESVTVIQNESATGINLQLVKGGFITGRVTEKESSEPIPNCPVGFYDAARPRSGAAMHSATTDENGYYRFRAAPGLAYVYISYSPPEGYYVDNNDPNRTRNITVLEGETLTGIDFQLIRSIDIYGMVQTVDGKPVQGAKITASFSSSYGVISDENGNFTLKGRKDTDTLKIQAEHTGKKLKGINEINVLEDTEVIITVEPYELVHVHGIIVDEEGTPIPDVNIHVMRWKQGANYGMSMVETVTNSLGEYHVNNLNFNDRYRISASKEGYGNEQIPLPELRADMPQLETVIMKKAKRWLEGTILDNEGNSVRGARVYTSTSSNALSGHKEVSTDNNGYYRLDYLVVVVEPEITIEHNDYGIYRFRDVDTNKETDFSLTIPKYHMSGVVLDENGGTAERSNRFDRPPAARYWQIIYWNVY